MTLKVIDLPALFPAGEWSFNKEAYVVKVGQYWEVAADVSAAGVVLTALGKSLVAPAEPTEPEKAAPVETKPFASKLRSSKRTFAPEDLESLDG